MTQRPLRKHTEVLAELIDPARERVVDVGCGRGALPRRLAQAGGDVLGLEPQEAELRKARAEDTDGAVGWAVAAGEQLPLPDGGRDVVLYFNALHHVPVDRIADAIAEAHRALAPGGRLVAIEPVAEGPQFNVTRMVDDETEVRRAADEALERAAGTPAWTRTQRFEYLAPAKYAAFEQLRDQLLAIDPRRREAVARHENAMRETFYATARQEGGVYWLDQPCRCTVLRRAEGGN